MYKKVENDFGVKSCESSQARELSSDCTPNPLASRLVYDSGELSSNMADMPNDAGVVVEIRPTYRPDRKGKEEIEFRTLKRLKNV